VRPGPLLWRRRCPLARRGAAGRPSPQTAGRAAGCGWPRGGPTAPRGCSGLAARPAPARGGDGYRTSTSVSCGLFPELGERLRTQGESSASSGSSSHAIRAGKAGSSESCCLFDQVKDGATNGAVRLVCDLLTSDRGEGTRAWTRGRNASPVGGHGVAGKGRLPSGEQKVAQKSALQFLEGARVLRPGQGMHGQEDGRKTDDERYVSPGKQKVQHGQSLRVSISTPEGTAQERADFTKGWSNCRHTQ
jgi:hypothetical protein